MARGQESKRIFAFQTFTSLLPCGKTYVGETRKIRMLSRMHSKRCDVCRCSKIVESNEPDVFITTDKYRNVPSQYAIDTARARDAARARDVAARV